MDRGIGTAGPSSLALATYVLGVELEREGVL
jgi:hypothetical protein